MVKTASNSRLSGKAISARTSSMDALGAQFNIEGSVSLHKGEPNSPLVFVFSSLNSNGFSFYKHFSDGKESKVFVRDPFDDWYHQGISAELSSIEKSAEYFKEIIKYVRPSKTLFTGSSMGGYAALIFGLLLRGNSVFAMSPQTVIDSRLPHTPKSDHTASKFFDLYDLVRTNNRHRPSINVAYGSDDMVDVWNAVRLVSRPGDNSFPIAGRDHLASVLLAGNGDLRQVIKQLGAGLNPSINAELDRTCEEPRTRKIIDRLVRAIYFSEQGLEEEEWALRLARIHPTWSVPYDALATIYKGESDWKKAEDFARNAANLAPNSITLQTAHAEILMRLGWEDRAKNAYEKCLRIRPKHYAALCALGILFARAGDLARATEFLNDAIKIRPRLNRAVSLLHVINTGGIPNLPNAVEQIEDM